MYQGLPLQCSKWMQEKQMCKNEWPDWRYSKGQKISIENYGDTSTSTFQRSNEFFIPIYQLRTKAELLQLNHTQFPSLGIFDGKKVGNWKN